MVVNNLGLNYIDYFFIAVFTLSILFGLMRGLAREILSIVTLITAVIVASKFAHPLAEHFSHTDKVHSAINKLTTLGGEQPVSYVAYSVSYGLLFFSILIVGAFINYFLSAMLQTALLGMGNRLLGGGFGLVRAVIISFVAIFVVQLTSYKDEDAWQASRFVYTLQPYAEKFITISNPTFEKIKGKLGI